MNADDSHNGFTVQYLVDGEDVTTDIAGTFACHFQDVPARKSVRMLVKITNDSATAGSATYFGIGTYVGGCSTFSDIVFAHVKAGS
jgi:hypothetical protein